MRYRKHTETRALPKAAFNPFIVSTDVQKTDDKTRKLIRSHVMLGKNRGKKRIPKESTVKEAKTSSTKAPSSNLSSDNEFRASIPPKVGCETSLIKLAADVEPLLVQNVLRCRSLQWLGKHQDSEMLTVGQSPRTPKPNSSRSNPASTSAATKANGSSRSATTTSTAMPSSLPRKQPSAWAPAKTPMDPQHLTTSARRSGCSACDWHRVIAP